MNFKFDGQDYPYTSRRRVIYARRGMVCTSQPLSAQAGLTMLQQGGNAIDAAIATAICQTIVEPTNTGLGSDCFALVWVKDKLYGLNGSGYAPTYLTAEAAKKAGLSWRKRQTSPRIKGRHLQECCFSPRWRSSIIAAYSILSGHLREAAFQSMLHQLRSVAAHFAGSKADIGTGPGRSPSPFPSGCRSRRWPVRHRVCWQRASSSFPSQRA